MRNLNIPSPLRRPVLRVFANISANLAAAWFIALFITRNPLLLTADILGVIVSVYLAFKAEQLLEEL